MYRSGQDRSLQNNVQSTFILSLFIGSHLPAGDPSASRTHNQTLLRGWFRCAAHPPSCLLYTSVGQAACLEHSAQNRVEKRQPQPESERRRAVLQKVRQPVVRPAAQVGDCLLYTSTSSKSYRRIILQGPPSSYSAARSAGRI